MLRPCRRRTGSACAKRTAVFVCCSIFPRSATIPGLSLIHIYEIRAYYEKHKDSLYDRNVLHMGLIVYNPNVNARSIAAQIASAVSYTHLDVYKRQSTSSSTLRGRP